MERAREVAGQRGQVPAWASTVKWVGAALVAAGALSLVLRVTMNKPHWAVGSVVAGTGVVTLLTGCYWGRPVAAPRQVVRPVIERPQAAVAVEAPSVPAGPPAWLKPIVETLAYMGGCQDLLQGEQAAEAVNRHAQELRRRLDEDGVMENLAAVQNRRAVLEADLQLCSDYPRLEGLHADGRARYHRPVSDLERQRMERGFMARPGNADDIRAARTDLQACQSELDGFNARIMPVEAAELLALILQSPAQRTWVGTVRGKLAQMGRCADVVNGGHLAVSRYAGELRQRLAQPLSRLEATRRALQRSQIHLSLCRNPPHAVDLRVGPYDRQVSALERARLVEGWIETPIQQAEAQVTLWTEQLNGINGQLYPLYAAETLARLLEATGS